MRLVLGCDETLRLFRVLQHLYAIAETGVPLDAYMQELDKASSAGIFRSPLTRRRILSLMPVKHR